MGVGVLDEFIIVAIYSMVIFYCWLLIYEILKRQIVFDKLKGNFNCFLMPVWTIYQHYTVGKI